MRIEKVVYMHKAERDEWTSQRNGDMSKEVRKNGMRIEPGKTVRVEGCSYTLCP
jgi:hypothetical protein